MTMQSSQYTSPFLQFKLSKPSKVEKPQHQMKQHNSHVFVQQEHVAPQPKSSNSSNPPMMMQNYHYIPPIFVNNSPPSQISSQILPPPQEALQHQFTMSSSQPQYHQQFMTQPEKKVKKSKRTQSPPVPASQQATQPAYIHWKFNESFDNSPQQSTSTSSLPSSTSTVGKSTNSKRSKKVKYGCLAFSLSDCTLVNNVNYQRPHHNTNNNWLPSSNIPNCNIIQSSQPTFPIESKESNIPSNNSNNQLHGILNYSNNSEHSLHIAKNQEANMVKNQESPLTTVETSLSPNQVSPRVIRTNISIKDILN